MPELPSERRGKLANLNGVKLNDVALLVERNHDAFALDAIKGGGEPEQVVKHLVNNLSDGLGELTTEALAQLVQMENKSEITSTQAKKMLGELVLRGGIPSDLATELGFEAVSVKDLENLVDQLIDEHSDEWERFCSGDTKVQGFFVGQVMKSTSGQADGKAINKIRGLEDLADGINALQKNEIGDPKKFVLGGRSAGGTLAAYVANEHPALINTVVLENAFLDIVNTLIGTHQCLFSQDIFHTHNNSSKQG